MSAPRKHDQEFRERASRMYRERLEETGESKRSVRRHVGALLDLNPETLRNWFEEHERAEPGAAVGGVGRGPGAAPSGRGVETANEILKTSAAFFAQAELERRLR